MSSRTSLRLPKVAVVAFSVMLVLAVLSGCGSNGVDPEPVWTAAAGVPEASEVAPAVAPATEHVPDPATALPTAVPASPMPTATPPAPLAAVVNGQYVFLADYQLRLDMYEQALLDQGLDPDTQEGHAQLDQVAEDVLENMISAVLIEQSAAGLGVTVGDEELEEQIEADIAAGGGEAAFDEWLQAIGQTRKDYREVSRLSLISQRVLDAVTADVSDTAEQVHARHIVVATEDEAEEIVGLIEGGADFADLARERSVDVASRDDGGDFGWFPRGLVAPEIENAAFSLKPGEISDVFILAESYHIVLVVERDDARELSPEALIELRLSVFDRWLDEQRADAKIERLVGP